MNSRGTLSGEVYISTMCLRGFSMIPSAPDIRKVLMMLRALAGVTALPVERGLVPALAPIAAG